MANLPRNNEFDREMVDAIRESIGLEPLYGHSDEPIIIRRKLKKKENLLGETL